ncbi:MAG: hypothetical protein WBN75_08355 [Verrucomicrobiia bacterium]
MRYDTSFCPVLCCQGSFNQIHLPTIQLSTACAFFSMVRAVSEDLDILRKTAIFRRLLLMGPSKRLLFFFQPDKNHADPRRL